MTRVRFEFPQFFFFVFLNICFSFFKDAIASAESVRVAPSLRSQKGAIWTKQRTNFDNWEIEIVFRVSGRGRIGADGLVSNSYSIASN